MKRARTAMVSGGLKPAAEAGGGGFQQLRTRTRMDVAAYLLGPAADLVVIFSPLERKRTVNRTVNTSVTVFSC